MHFWKEFSANKFFGVQNGGFIKSPKGQTIMCCMHNVHPAVQTLVKTASSLNAVLKALYSIPDKSCELHTFHQI